MNTIYKVWCEPIFRGGKLILVKGDVAEAIRKYHEETGHLPVKIALNPVNQYHTEEIPEGIEVEFLGSICFWEVWLADGLKKEEFYPPEEKIAPANPPEKPAGRAVPQIQGHKTPEPIKDTTRIMKQVEKEQEIPVVSKIPSGRRGRPVEIGACSKTTLWRRARKAKEQGVLL